MTGLAPGMLNRVGGTGRQWLCVFACATALSCTGTDAETPVSSAHGLGGSSEGMDTNWWTEGDPPDTADTTTGGKAGSTTDDLDDSGPAGPPDLGSCSGPADCVIDNTTCYLPQGVCSGGMCDFEAKAAGSACDDGDPCTELDACDGFGFCDGTPKQCVGGECVMGQCTVAECDEGTADCNDDPADGCETLLGTNSDCGGCGESCNAGDNASGSCAGNSCEFSCNAGFGNCDEDWTNGCEIPLGANQCDAGGLNPNGCWTSHCGNSADADAVNFGTWFCYECTTCDVPASGQCRWCDHATGNWFPADSCACGSFEGLACGP